MSNAILQKVREEMARRKTDADVLTIAHGLGWFTRSPEWLGCKDLTILDMWQRAKKLSGYPNEDKPEPSGMELYFSVALSAVKAIRAVTEDPSVNQMTASDFLRAQFFWDIAQAVKLKEAMLRQLPGQNLEIPAMMRDKARHKSTWAKFESLTLGGPWIMPHAEEAWEPTVPAIMLNEERGLLVPIPPPTGIYEKRVRAHPGDCGQFDMDMAAYRAAGWTVAVDDGQKTATVTKAANRVQ